MDKPWRPLNLQKLTRAPEEYEFSEEKSKQNGRKKQTKRTNPKPEKKNSQNLKPPED